MLFNKGDLILCNIQYSKVFKNTNDFKLREEVFLKSNPDHIMQVAIITSDRVICLSIDKEGNRSMIPFKPECILQPRYKDLVRKIT